MSTQIHCWELHNAGEPLVQSTREQPALGGGRVLVKVAGCGVCHTDVGYMFDGVRTRHDLPLTLGHEIAGTVVATGSEASHLADKAVVVPAVIPCGACKLCEQGRGMICRKQIFPGCDVHGGFASHVVVPAHGLCPVDEDALAKSDVTLADLSVLGDAISTPYQSIVRSGLKEGDVAIFVGAGGVGSFGVQIARAMGAHVVALDIDDQRLKRVFEHGASHVVNVRDQSPRDVRNGIRKFAKDHDWPSTCWKIYETSGTKAGQQQAFALLNHGAFLGVVGYTMDTVDLRLSNLMAFDATAQGSWGCLPEHYPAVLDLVLSGKVSVLPFIERRPMSQINDTMTALRDHKLVNRPVLIPDFE
jgi:6-hydroxycyclohex-1-ene-1-carbonyl-CoA dehydrogenase